MFATVYSAAVLGIQGYQVDVEVSSSPGQFKLLVVGLPDAAVRESIHRVKCSTSNGMG